MNIWYAALIKGIQNINWEVFEKEFLPVIMKMVNFSCTEASRSVAAHIIKASAHVLAKENRLSGDILKAYLSLCLDPISSIQRSTLSNLCGLLQELTAEFTETHFLPTVNKD